MAVQADHIHTSDKNPAAALGAFAHGFDLDRVPEAVRERAKLNMLDALGIGLAATRFEFADIAARAIADMAGDGACPVIGRPLRLPLRDAVHLNGILVHGLDFDDTHTTAVVHTSASTVPTSLGAACHHGASGRDLLAAFIISTECASRIGAAARGGFHVKGFHPTGVVAALANTLGAGYLYRLKPEQYVDAQGLVLSKAAGSMQFLDDGAWSKRSHPGWAGVAALTAVNLAAHGYFGPRDPYFGRYGLYRLYMRDDAPIDPEPLSAGFGEHWSMSEIAFKPYPCCHYNHAFNDCALALKRAHEFTVADIAKIICRIHPEQVAVVCEPEATKKRPQNTYDAQFSVAYSVAATLIRDRFGLTELDDASIRDPAILALGDRVEYTEDPDSAFPAHFSGAMDIHLNDGRVLQHREQMNRGSAENPMLPEEIRGKFAANAAPTIGETQAASLADRVLAIEGEDSLEALCRDLVPDQDC